MEGGRIKDFKISGAKHSWIWPYFLLKYNSQLFILTYLLHEAESFLRS